MIEKKIRFRERLKNHNADGSFEIEECCDNPSIEEKNGKYTCTSCGTEIDEVIRATTVQAFTREEVEKRKHDAPKWRKFGNRTLIGKVGSHIDYRGAQMNSKNKTLFNRLSKINNSLISSIERNFWEAEPQLKLICSKLNIPKYIKETAWRIYEEGIKKKLAQGRSVAGLIGGALYISIRVHEFPRLLDEVVEALLLPRRTVHKAMSLLIKEVLPELGLKYKLLTPSMLIYRFGNDLNLPMEIQQIGIKIFSRAVKSGFIQTGKDPRGAAAAAIYLAAKYHNKGNLKKTQKEISLISKITEVTLRSRVKEFRKTEGSPNQSIIKK